MPNTDWRDTLQNEEEDGTLEIDIVCVTVIASQFPLGAIVITDGASEELERLGKQPEEYIMRHASRDWGDLCEEDKQANDYACDNGGRLLSAYETSPERKVWIITESDRSATTVLTPEEY